MCNFVGGTPNLDLGWVCCGCKAYNNLARGLCKNCPKSRCLSLTKIQPNPTSVDLLSSADVKLFGDDFKTAVEAVERILLRVEGLESLRGRSLIEVVQAFLMSGALESAAPTLERISEIMKRLPFAREAHDLGLSAATLVGSQFKH